MRFLQNFEYDEYYYVFASLVKCKNSTDNQHWCKSDDEIEQFNEKIKTVSADDISSLRLDPADFRLYMNPRILGETVAHDHKWQFCLSFPQLRCLVRRPIGIHVSYLNEEGDEVTQRLYDFHARMFLHEMDHLKGRTMMHWRLSEGNIDIMRGIPQDCHSLRRLPKLNPTTIYT